MVDIKIRDEEIYNYSETVKELFDYMNTQLAKLKNQLQYVCDNGVISGNFHNNLQLFADTISSVNNDFFTVGVDLGCAAETYIDEINLIDSETY